MKLNLKVWRQKGPNDRGGFRNYTVEANEHMSFL